MKEGEDVFVDLFGLLDKDRCAALSSTCSLAPGMALARARALATGT
jgi:hypothetical protein